MSVLREKEKENKDHNKNSETLRTFLCEAGGCARVEVGEEVGAVESGGG